MTEAQRLARIDLQSPRAVSAAMKITKSDMYAHCADVAERLMFVRWLILTGRLHD